MRIVQFWRIIRRLKTDYQLIVFPFCVFTAVICLTACQHVGAPTGTLQGTISSIPTENKSTATEMVPTRIIENTLTPASAVIPAISPTSKEVSIGDGIKFVYEQNRKLWLWHDGNRTSVASVINNKRIWMSDDGFYIAYNADLDELGFFDLWVSDLQGNHRQLLSSATLSTMASAGLGLEWPQIQLEWIPKTHKLLLNDYKDGRLYLTDVDTGETKQIFQFPQPGFIHISPNGTTAVLVGKSTLYQFNLTTYQASNLTDLLSSLINKEWPSSPKLIWMNEAQKLRVALTVTEQNAGIQEFEIIDIDLLNRRATPLSRVEVYSALLELSPKGDWVVFAKKVTESNAQQIILHARNLNTGTDHEIMTDPEVILGWSMDEQKLAVRSLGANGNIDKIIFLEQDVPTVDFPRPIKFIAWLDSDRYLNSYGEIHSVLSSDQITVINNYQSNPFDYVLTNR